MKTYAVECQFPGVVWECWKARIQTRKEAEAYVDHMKALEASEPVRSQWRIIEMEGNQ